MNRTKAFTTGLVIAGLLALGDVATAFTTDGEHPPVPIAIAGALLGLITLAGVVLGRRGNRGWLTAIIVTRLLSAVAALPALVVDGVPGPIRGVAAAGIVLTLIAVALVATALRRPVAVPA
jgi:hypothetical protein